VALTQITLTVAGAIFMMVLSTQQSFQFTIDRIFDGFGFDVLVIFEQDQRIAKSSPINAPDVTPKVGFSRPQRQVRILT
jgi:hypothetical protein